MADEKLTALTAIVNAGGDEIIYIVDDPGGTPVSRKITVANLLKTLTSPTINTGVSGTAILDEDDMSTDSDTQLATQQSIKAYADLMLPLAGGTLSGDIEMADNNINRAVLKDYGEDTETDATSTATKTLDIAAEGNVFDITLTDNCTFTFSNPSASGTACSFTLICRQDGTGSRTVTWPASVDWPSATAPTLSTGASDVDVFTFLTIDAGTTWLGFTAGLDLS